MEEEISRMIRMARGAIARTIDGSAATFCPNLEDTTDDTAYALGCIVTKTAGSPVKVIVVNQIRITCGIVTGFAGAVGGGTHLAAVIPCFSMV